MKEEGAAGIVLLAVAGLALVLTVGLAAVTTVLAARGRAQTAADAAALAAAPVTFRSFGAAGSAADEARRFAGANGARLVSCRCAPDSSWAPRTVRVVVEIPVSFGPLPTVGVRAEGRAVFTPSFLAVRPQ